MLKTMKTVNVVLVEQKSHANRTEFLTVAV